MKLPSLLIALAFVAATHEGCSNSTAPNDLTDVVDQVSSDVADTQGQPDAEPDTGEPWPDLEPVVFAVISDIHIDGGLDASTPQRVSGLFDKVELLSPAPEFLVITGDMTETLHEPVDAGEGSRFHTLQTILNSSQLEVEACLGNHDYYMSDDLLYEFTNDRDARDQLFNSELGIKPWYYTIHGGTRFVYLNSMHGDRWDESLGLNGSMGQEQLEWLDTLLSDGRPSLLFLHHPPSTVLETADTTLESVMMKHSDSVLAVFVGHVHVFARTELAGIPIYVTGAGYRGEAYHHVRVNAAKGEIQILNEADIDYGETSAVDCKAGQAPGNALLDGKTMGIHIPDAHIEPLGLGTYLRDMVASMPIVVKLQATAGGGLGGWLTTGTFKGDSAGDSPAYVGAVSGAACQVLHFSTDGPCLVSEPVDLRVDLGPMLGLPLPPGWAIHADFRDFSLMGLVGEGGVLSNGQVATLIDLSVAVNDVEGIIMNQYCASKINGCKPGYAGMPECPTEPDASFFEAIPEKCDVDIAGVGLRMLFRVMDSIDGYSVALDANFSTWPLVLASEQAAGSADPALFAVEPEGKCEGLQ